MLEIRHENIDDFNNLQRGYDDIFSGQGLQHPDSFYLWLINLLKPVPGRCLIDISCGQGRLTILAKQKGLQAIGLDISMGGLLKARHSCAEIDLSAGNGECLPLKSACADYVMHIGSLEHYLDPCLGAQEIARVLKPGRLACILLPNAYGLLGNVQFVARHGDIHDDGQPLQRYATRRCWETLLTDAGLIVQCVLPYGEVVFPRTKKDAIYMLTHLRKLLRLLILPIIPINLSNHLVYLCSRE